MKTRFQIASVRLAVSAGNELLEPSSDLQSSQEKSSAHFSSRVSKWFDVGSVFKFPSAGAKKTQRPQKS